MTALVLALIITAADEPVKPKMPLGKDTTVVDGPLTADGYVDYSKALQARLGKGVTAETNALVLIWKASGPHPEGPTGMHADYFTALGFDPPPVEGDYSIASGVFAKTVLQLDDAGMKAFLNQQDKLYDRPWSAQAHPNFVAYLAANEKPLTLVAEAARRRDYFNPLISTRKDGEPNLLIGALLPIVQKCREYFAALAMRSMMKLGAKDYDGAWADIVTMQRLARLMSRGNTLIEHLVAIACESIAHKATLSYLEHAPLTADQVRAKWKDIDALPAMQPMWTKLDLTERFLYLDCMQMLRRGRVEGLDVNMKLTPEQVKALDTIDWSPILREGNQWYDKMVAAAKLPGRGDRKQAMVDIEDDLRKRKAKFQQSTLSQFFNALDVSGKAQTRRAAEMLIDLLLPAVTKVQEAEDRRNQTFEHVRLAFGLAAFKADNAKYPKQLDELSPKYLAKLPGDSFSGKPLNYTSDGTSFMLWSVGPNGKDDNGRGRDDSPRGDDITITMPFKPAPAATP
jgi:hypothetical protein